jgi:hypothetical protein
MKTYLTKHFIWALLLILLTISCKNKNNQYVSDWVKEWQNKEIVFSDSLVFAHYAEDTVDYKIPENEYKIIVYVSSSECTSCMLQLSAWKLFLHDIDSVTHRNIPCLFIVNPPRILDLIVLLELAEWEIPVCVDMNNDFAVINKIPVNANFHTFLLNEQNRVVLIGNPMQNIEIAKLYFQYFVKNK